jgi:hypothetical protein
MGACPSCQPPPLSVIQAILSLRQSKGFTGTPDHFVNIYLNLPYIQFMLSLQSGVHP